MTPSPAPLHPAGPAGPEHGSSSPVDEALDLLVTEALGAHRPAAPGSSDVERAADLLRRSIADLAANQAALAEALIASQDRMLDLQTLAQVSVHGVASEETVGLLLDRALQLTGARQVLVLEDGVVTEARGDAGDLAAHTDLARRAIAEGADGALRAAASDSAMVGRLDLDGAVARHVAFFRAAERPFSTTDLPLLEAIKSALGVMMAFNEMHRRELAQAAVEREHQLASALAQSVITDEPPLSPSLHIYARSVPASLTGGDFYVFGQHDGSIWFTVGDVAGKGLPAAMLMTRAVAACRVAFLAHRGHDVADVFRRIEEELFDHLDEAGLFLTLAVGLIDESSRRVSIVNAGHSPVVLVNRDGVGPVPSSVPPLGIVRGRTPAVATFTLDADDCLFVGSDGLVDQARPDGELFGYERFTALCRDASTLPAPRRGEAVLERVATFASGTPASDDTTLVVVSTGGTS